jgi:branched-chain amino acid transport system ATP-binding protein
MALLEVRELEVRYGGSIAVRGIDFDVNQSEVVVILGANGAGKTSTLRTLAGDLRPSRGSIRWDGADISRWPSHRVARSGLVMVPEGRKVFAPLTVAENLLIGGYTNSSKVGRERIMDDVVDMFPVLGKRRNQAAGLLSGGEQQMLAFGRALMADPQVILMDEPSMGLAPAVVDNVFESISVIASTGVGILVVEQNASAALDIADRAIVIERGLIAIAGTATEIKGHPDVVRAFLGDMAS